MKKTDYLYLIVCLLILTLPGASFAFVPPATVAGNVLTLVPMAQTAAPVSYGAVSSGKLSTSVAGQVLLGGKNIQVTVQGGMTLGKISTALGKFMGRNLPGVALAASVVSLAIDLGFRIGPAVPGGQPVVEKTDPSKCSVAPCYVFELTTRGNAPNMTGTDAVALCVRYSPLVYNGGGGYFSRSAPNTNTTTCFTDVRGPGTSWEDAPYVGQINMNYTVGTIPPVPAEYLPATTEELLQALANKETVNADKAKAVVADLTTANEPVEIVPVSVTGPFAEETSVTVVTDSVTGATTTTRRFSNYSYNGPSITATTSENVTTRDAAGTVTGSTATTQADTATKDQCASSPDSAGCTKLGNAPTGETIPFLNIPVSITSVLFAAPTGCPPGIPYTMFAKSYTLPFSPLCDLMAMLRPLFLAVGAAAAAWVFMEGLKT